MSKLKMELDLNVTSAHDHGTDVVMHIPDIKDEDYIPWTMEKSYFYPLALDCHSNVMVVLLKMYKTGSALTHYHCGPLYGYMLQGGIKYDEKGGVVINPGDIIIESTGVLHTAEVFTDEPAIIMATFRSGVIFAEKKDIDDPVASVQMYQDAYFMYNRAKEYYKEQGKDFSKIERISVLSHAQRAPSK